MLLFSTSWPCRSRVRAGWVSLCAAFVTFASAGCATVSVRKVPTPTQYVRWTDEMQREADRIEGIRFYLPRPFISVFESFPVRTDIYIANGVVSPDGQFVLIRGIRPESGLGNYMARQTVEVAVPRREVLRPSSPELQGDVEDEEAAAEAGAESPQESDGAPPAQPEAPAPPRPRTGITQGTVTNDNGAFAYQPLRGNFDLVYMPDFEEQYAVSGSADLGNTTFAVNLGQGWSLQGFNSLTDNSQLNDRIFDVIDTSIELAKTAATKGLDRLLADMAAGGTKAIEPQGDVMEEADPGTPVTLKIVVVHYAAKGLYPVIKPRELQERVINSTPSYFFLDLFRAFPTVRPASEFDATALERARYAIEKQTGNFTVPRYPYQYVSFNTFRYMAIELVKPEGAPFGNLYDRTGTVGDPGAVSSVETLIQLIKEMYPQADGQEPAARSPSSDKPANTPEAVFLAAVKQSVTFPAGAGEGTARYFVSKAVLSQDRSTVTVTLNASPQGPPPDITREAVEAAITEQVNARRDQHRLTGLEKVEVEYAPETTAPPVDD